MSIQAIETNIDHAIAMLPRDEDGPNGRKIRKLRDALLSAKAWCRSIEQDRMRFANMVESLR